MAFNLFLSLAAPMQAFALTGGPSQPEVQSFEPVSANQMVDPFTGDFTYNIPLLDVGGYPINISYHAGPGLDEEASWVGLGWNINPGVINRNMRGIPDDFFSPNPEPEHADNDYIKRTTKMKPSRTLGVGLSPKLEIFSQGKEAFLTLGINFNNYRGFGFNTSFAPTDGKFPYSVSFSSQSGLGVNVNISFAKVFSKKKGIVSKKTTYGYIDEVDATDIFGGSIGASLNSREGITDLGFQIDKVRARQRVLSDNKGENGSKRERYRGGMSAQKGSNSSSISFLNSTYIPATSDRNYSLSFDFSLELGKKFYGLNPDSRMSLSYNQTGVFRKDWERTYPTYGYMYQAQANNNFEQIDDNDNKGRALTDFNTYGQSVLSKAEVKLPYAVSTYDILSVSGQGISGMYRAHSASVGTAYDQTAETRNIPPLSVGIDLGVTATAKFGVDISSSYFKSKSGRWDENNDILEYTDFANTRTGADFEQVYFKGVGEKTAIDQSFYDIVDGGAAARPEMDTRLTSKNSNNSAKGIRLTNNLKTWVNDPTISSDVIRQKRDKRNQIITILTAKEVEGFGLKKDRNFYAKDHHIGEITAINPGGSRYVYAQPIYNTLQESYSFSFNKDDGSRSVDAATNIAWYENDDASKMNNMWEKFFDYEKIPPYAHSYLLSAVLSPDYMDITGDGPTPDDNGSYTNITYATPFIYNWRTPYAPPSGTLYSANYQKGLESDEQDDKASFVYGQKEITYVKEIETKTHIAIFYTSGREDGLGVTSNNGGKNSAVKLQRLDSIQLFTTYDYYNYPTSCKPLKVVYFKYDYSLCPNVPNNSGFDIVEDNEHINLNKGKLTLKKIFFRYGDSKNSSIDIASLNPYNFEYSTNNYDYGYKNYDRWGNYKEEQSTPSNHEFPYSEQDQTLANNYASAWSLSKIILPSGGTINIEYEADDYAYVQDKAAMEMFKIEGFGSSSDFSASTNLLFTSNSNHNDHIFFELKDNETDITSYLPQPSSIDNKRYLYINAKTKIKQDKTTLDSYYEYVRTYAEIENWGVTTYNSKDYGYFIIKKVPINETIGLSFGNVNPIAKNAWQVLRTQTPFLVYEGANTVRGGFGNGGVDKDIIRQALFTILGIIPELNRTLRGFNTVQMDAGNGDRVKLNESWIRLQSPSLKKIGGGVRVKKVLINNDWANISGEESQTLGQIYDYTMVENGKTISSGVASYEPQIGGDENPHRLPSFYSTKKLGSLGQENFFYHDEPLGESLYPSPSVGYRQITVRNIKPDEDDDANTTGSITRHGTGYVIQKFYTAYDFPVYTEKTPVSADFKKSPVLSLLKLSQEIVGATQGFAIETNDMHGKPKAQETYDEYGKLITKTEYTYKTDPDNTKRLSNTVTALRSDGTVSRNTIVGYEVDMLIHPRQLIEEGITGRINSDADVFFIGLAPIITPGFGINLNGSYKMVRTATATKIINRFGILESVTVTDQSSSVTTINKAFDEETGEVLLTETTNEFNDQVFNFTYPAHWAYDEGMGAAYKNVGASFSSVTTTSGVAPFSNTEAQYIVEGDEFIADNGTSTIRVWALDKYNNSGVDYKISFIDREGNSIADDTYTLKNIRSGRRNMQTVPVGTIVGNTNPIPDVGSSFFTNGEVVMDAINASAATFSDHWQAFRHDPGCWDKDCDPNPPTYERNFGGEAGYYCLFSDLETSPINFPKANNAVNPYVLGIKGNWRPDYTYVYYDRGQATSQRQQVNTGTSPFNGTNIAEDGRLNSFKPFWYVSGNDWANRGKDASQTNNPWLWNSVAKQINPDGIELENENALNIFSSAIYSFISKQPLAVTYNAELRETLFEGFEDYPVIDHDVLSCEGFPSATILSPSFSTTPINSTNTTEKTKLITTPFHWYFWPTLHHQDVRWAIITENEAHTGKKSLEVLGSEIKIPTEIYDNTTGLNNNNPTSFALSQYLVNNEDLTDIFSPNQTTPQLLTYWVKSNELPNATVSIELQGTPIALTLLSESKPIEGWVKREYSFNFSTVSTGNIVDVIISSPTVSSISYFDDIRIHPMDANMKSFVYDNNTQRLMATLDENNYATFFEYDEEGNLVRTKRETERGIITINENRQNIKH